METWHRVSDSNDATVKCACQILSDYHEDYSDYVHLMEKQEWDHLERLRLVLLSGANMQRYSRCEFDRHRFMACSGLIAFLIVVLLTGFGWHLLIATSSVGILMVLYLWLFRQAKSLDSPYKKVIEPFTSIRQLDQFYRATDSFKKNRFPKEWGDSNEIWGLGKWVINAYWIAIAGAILLTLSPMILLIMAIPDFDPEFRVTTRVPLN